MPATTLRTPEISMRPRYVGSSKISSTLDIHAAGTSSISCSQSRDCQTLREDPTDAARLRPFFQTAADAGEAKRAFIDGCLKKPGA